MQDMTRAETPAPGPFARTAMLFGQAGMERLLAARVAVFGIGGVGGYTAEAIARSGIGAIDLFDHDKICLSNINRQIIATYKTIGLYKVDVMQTRILEINPDAKVTAYRLFYAPETADDIDLAAYDYVVDAMDTMTAKLELVSRAMALGVPVISSMGAANKMDPTAFEVADIYETSVCPLARIMRKELRKRNIDSLKVVYSKEPPTRQTEPESELESPESQECTDGATGCVGVLVRQRQIPASNAFVPPVAGLILAGEVIKDLIQAGKNRGIDRER